MRKAKPLCTNPNEQVHLKKEFRKPENQKHSESNGCRSDLLKVELIHIVISMRFANRFYGQNANLYWISTRTSV